MKTRLTARLIALAAGIIPAAVASTALAQPTYISIPGYCSDVNNGGTVVVGGSGDSTFRWTRSGSIGSVAFLINGLGGRPHCSADGTVVVSDMANGENATNGFSPEVVISGHWTDIAGYQSYGIFTTNPPFPALGTPIPPGTLNTPFDCSDDGNIAVGLAYVTGGDPFSAFRAFRADLAAGTLISLGQQGGQGSRANCVSGDGNVIGGWDRDPDTSIDRPSVWRYNPADGSVQQFVLVGPGGLGEIGACNSDGSVIAGNSSEFDGELVKWTWDGTSYTPTSLGGLGGFGGSVTVNGMSADGSVIVGSSGGFFFGQDAFIWTAGTGIVKLADYLRGLNATGVDENTNFSAALSISPDGSALTVGGFFAPSGVVILNGAGICVAPVIGPAPSTTEISRCDNFVFLNASASGSGPFSYQWRKNGENIAPGPTGNGSTYAEGFFPSQFIVQNAVPADAGSYDCIVTNSCGNATIPPIVVTARAPDPYDTCETALDASGTGTFALSMCGAYIDEYPASCVAGPQGADVWIRYTALTEDDYRISTCDGPGYDTILSVYDSCGGSEIGCNDDYCYSTASIERIHLTRNQVIYVRLAASFVPPDPVGVSFSIALPPPANDVCANAEDISADGAYTWDTTAADTDGTQSCGFGTGKDVWFRYTPAANGAVTLNTCGSTINAVLSVFDSCGGTELACDSSSVFTNECFFQSQIENLVVTAGTPVLVRVAGRSTFLGGGGVLNVTLGPVPCQADFNNDGVLNSDDLSDFITGYFDVPSDPRCDFNGDTVINADDLGDFITAYFNGCA